MDKVKMFFSALYHDVGKPAATVFDESKQDYKAYGHERVNLEAIENKIIPKKYQKSIKALVKNHMITEEISDKKILKKAEELKKDSVSMKELLSLRIADGLGRIGKRTRQETIQRHTEFEDRVKELGVFEDVLPQLIQGQDLIKLGLKPSNFFGELIREVRELQLALRIKTKEDAIKYIKKRIDF